MPGATRWFQLHPDQGRTREEDRVLARCLVPVYVVPQAGGKRVQPLARPYPAATLAWIQRLGGPLSSSFDYMLALALHEATWDPIHLVGLALQYGTPRERLIEHVSMAHWIGVARGQGRTVRIEPVRLRGWRGPGVLRHPYRYGFEYDAERTWGQRMCWWALLRGLRLEDFDDNGAKTGPRGWRGTVSPARVALSI